MLDCLTQLGIFFKYSPKRTRRLEQEIEATNENRTEENKITIKKLKLFCQTRWAEKYSTLHEFNLQYEPILNTLEAIGSTEAGWDAKSSGDAYGLMELISCDSTFMASFQTVLHFFGYTKGLCVKLQGAMVDIIEAFDMVSTIEKLFLSIRNDDINQFDRIYTSIESMAAIAGIETIERPRTCGRQTQRNNVTAGSPKEYFRLSIFLPFLDYLIQQFTLRFDGLSKKSIGILKLIPSINTFTEEDIPGILALYKDDLPDPNTFSQELDLWKHMWETFNGEKPATISGTLAHPKTCRLLFPNITAVLHLILLTSVTAAGVECANSSLRFIKNSFRSTMGEERFNALILLYVHKDINLNIDDVIDRYAKKHPRKMTLQNPLS